MLWLRMLSEPRQTLSCKPRTKILGYNMVKQTVSLDSDGMQSHTMAYLTAALEEGLTSCEFLSRNLHAHTFALSHDLA